MHGAVGAGVGGVLGPAGAAGLSAPEKAVLAWEQANSDGFGSANNDSIGALVEYKGRLYAGTHNNSGGQVWRKELDGSWGQFMTAGLGDPNIPISAC